AAPPLASRHRRQRHRMSSRLGETKMRHARRPAAKARFAIIAIAAALLAGCASTWPSGTAVAPLAIHGNKTTFEIAPVLLASERAAPVGAAEIRMGGVHYLFSVGTQRPYLDLGIAVLAINAESQALRITLHNPKLQIIMT